MTGLQRLCLATCGVIFILIVIGGTVRATGSGMGCEDHWPKCDGKWIPNTDKETLIEYTHRSVAALAGFMVAGIGVTALVRYRRMPRIMTPAWLLGGLVIFQALLGAVVVVRELPPEIVTIHLGTALSIMSVLLLLTVTAFATRRPFPSLQVSSAFRKLLLAVMAMTLVLMLIGAYLAGSDYGLACNGWPLCNGEVVPSNMTTSVLVHYVHRVIAALLGASILTLLWLAWKEKARAPLVFNLTAAAFAVYIAQALVGASNIWTQLAPMASIGHLAVGTVLWIILALLSIRVFEIHQWLPESSESPAARGRLAKVSR